MRNASLLATLLVCLTATPALATPRQPPCPFPQGCSWQECDDMGSGGKTLCVYPKSAQLTPPAVFAPPVATMAPASTPVKACVAGNCGGNSGDGPCGIPWCVWGVIALGAFVAVYLIMSRIRLATALGDYRGHVAHWNLLVDAAGAPLPGVERAILIEVAKAMEAAWAEVNEIDWMRFLRIQNNDLTNRPGHAAPRGMPTTATGAAAVGGGTP